MKRVGSVADKSVMKAGTRAKGQRQREIRFERLLGLWCATAETDLGSVAAVGLTIEQARLEHEVQICALERLGGEE